MMERVSCFVRGVLRWRRVGIKLVMVLRGTGRKSGYPGRWGGGVAIMGAAFQAGKPGLEVPHCGIT